ncbi:MAG: hypothetical protein IT427_08295 [Pirellulales bacterium]|nr:hypothetical protein [Pirellulales bacterium]
MKLKWIPAALCCVLMTTSAVRAVDWKAAEKNGEQSQRMIDFCSNYVRGWLAYADGRSGLLPMGILKESQFYWNAKDSAADNYPFIVLTGEITGHYYTKLAARHILAQEQSLCNRLGALPDDFNFATQRFCHPKVDLERLIFGASEYCKDGLIPITEQLGPSPWLDRMQQLIHGVWDNAKVETPAGIIPTKTVEVNGDLMEVLSRMYWLTGDENYKQWCFRIMDYYCFHDPLTKWRRIPLRDHGCEVIAGMSEAYLLAAREDTARWQKYKPAMHALLDAILADGVNEDGLMYNWFSPTGDKQKDNSLSDGWGYVYNAYLTVAIADRADQYRLPVERVLTNLHKYRDRPWLPGADDYADSIEGAVNLLNRIPVKSAFEWVDSQSDKLMAFQHDDGILEGWYGDGNSARTMLMVAMWKTQGTTATPWRKELQLGAVRNDDGSVSISLQSDKLWSGELHFDQARHRQFFHMPVDYPRINQFPEWFTVDGDATYEVQVEGGATTLVDGKALLNYPVTLKTNETLHITIKATPQKPDANGQSAGSEANAGARQNSVN